MEIGFECSCDGFGCDDVARYNHVRLFAPAEDIALLKDPNEKVISKKDVVLVYKYPLTKQVSVPHSSEDGFDREKLIRTVSDDYHRFYRDEPDLIQKNGYKSEWEYLVLMRVKPIDDNTYEVRVEV